MRKQLQGLIGGSSEPPALRIGAHRSCASAGRHSRNPMMIRARVTAMVHASRLQLQFRRRCRRWLLVLSAAVSGFGGTPRPAPSAPPSNVQATARQAPHVMVFAGPPPGWPVTPAPPEPREAPQPAAGYPSLGVACDSVEALMKRTLTRNLEPTVSRA